MMATEPRMRSRVEKVSISSARNMSANSSRRYCTDAWNISLTVSKRKLGKLDAAHLEISALTVLKCKLERMEAAD